MQISFLILKLVHDLMGKQNVIMDRPVGNECTLERENEFIQETLKSVNHNFSNSFVERGAKANRPKVAGL